MKDKLKRIKPQILAASLGLASLAIFVVPKEAGAVMMKLNGAVNQTQSFVNDSNVTVTTNTTAGTHTFGWAGQLPMSRGGTGASSFSSGSVLFSNGSTFEQDNSNFFWDNLTKDIYLGKSIRLQPPALPDQVSESIIEASTPEGSFNDRGSFLGILAGTGTGNGDGGNLTLAAGSNLESGGGGSVSLVGGSGGESGGNGGSVFINGGSSNFGSGTGGDIILSTGSGGGGTDGKIILAGNNSGRAVLNSNLLTSPDKIFTFPNFTGTFSLLEADQTFTGLNKFEGTNDSTVYIGSSSKTGCIALGDSDGNGITYVTANDGVLTASTSKPDFCR